MHITHWEAFDCRTRVTEQHTPSTMAIHQIVDQLLARQSNFVLAGVAFQRFKQRLHILLRQKLSDFVFRFITQLLTAEQRSDGIRNRCVLLFFFNKGFVIVETICIQQAQTSKVAFTT
ncbi:Uncharacterised protein [Vibrio cholerae]|nr:Uncharacterised protein [Vibrio cholerae]CSB81422.1 Uncharacterised protein [Vibrio cholerae]